MLSKIAAGICFRASAVMPSHSPHQRPYRLLLQLLKALSELRGDVQPQ
jgi:hypothetical protein